ncbi:hypothetical protein BBJ28_00019025 [Nothophytophthora sp. Chile5]|nr:hypothetical protein BBJ28_00019025 [Nothophytophthora sp. Chile5]
MASICFGLLHALDSVLCTNNGWLSRDVVEGAIPRGTYSNSASASLVYKNSPYYFELRLTYKIDDSRGEWVFPMNPESAAAIEKRELAKLLQK